MAARLKGFTLAELLVTMIIFLMIVGILLGTNFVNQLYKARDVTRKENLAKLQRIIEDFHNDNGRYPSMNELAYELQDDVSADWNLALAGKICGREKSDSALNEYASVIPCDPRSPQSDYVYFLFDSKQKYAIFTTLENTADQDIAKIGCAYGCSYFLDPYDPAGSISNHYFNYYVSSSDFTISNCYSSVNYHACYPGRTNHNDRCKVCTGLSCEPGYATLYCSPNWCLQNCAY